MSQDLSDSQLKAIWRQGQISTIFKRAKPQPVLVRIPFSEGNQAWLRDGRRPKPKWNGQYKAWEIPTAWFDMGDATILVSPFASEMISLVERQQW